jgi:predicted RNA-binding Zn ribbon-like protein
LATQETNSEKRPPLFELMGGPVCLDFVNTLDDRTSAQPKELVKNYYDLAKFGEDTGILTPAQRDYFFENVHLRPDQAAEAVRRARRLREALYEIFSALLNGQSAPQAAMDTLNENLHDAALHSRLVQTEIAQTKIVQRETAQREARCEWRFEDMTSAYDALLWPIARSAGDLLASSDVALVRACSSPTCRWLFLDTSKNHHRRWCSMKQCGNRAKVRKFYARKKESAAKG